MVSHYDMSQESLERNTEIEFFRGSGPGGQHRNKTETGVRLRHIPSGIVVEAQDMRSQSQNRALAFVRLLERLEKLSKPKKRRVATKPSKASKEKMLLRKRAHSRKKQARKLLSIET